MNLIEIFQNWVAQVPDLLQPLIVALATRSPSSRARVLRASGSSAASTR